MQRFDEFLRKVARDTYPEPRSLQHDEITAKALPDVISRLKPGAFVLDVGCGQGVALEHFKRLGFPVIGTTLNDTDKKVLQEKGYSIQVCWQEDLPVIWENQFELVWARHVIEHSIAPFWTLHEFKRVLKPGGWLYLEVPAPDTPCEHQFNKNHYSVLTDSGWQSLLMRAGFNIVDAKAWKFNTPMGQDIYWSYLCNK